MRSAFVVPRRRGLEHSQRPSNLEAAAQHVAVHDFYGERDAAALRELQRVGTRLRRIWDSLPRSVSSCISSYGSSKMSETSSGIATSGRSTGVTALRARKFFLSSSDDVQPRSRGKPMKIGFRALFWLGS